MNSIFEIFNLFYQHFRGLHCGGIHGWNFYGCGFADVLDLLCGHLLHVLRRLIQFLANALGNSGENVSFHMYHLNIEEHEAHP